MNPHPSSDFQVIDSPASGFGLKSHLSWNVPHYEKQFQTVPVPDAGSVWFVVVERAAGVFISRGETGEGV
jgi:hypothetical protein